MEEEIRTVEVMVAGAGWSPVDFRELLEGDVFRMFEATGEVVMDDTGNTEWEAEGDAYERSGTWTIIVKFE